MAKPNLIKENALTTERLRELLRYDPETGIFTWKAHTGQGVHTKSGDIAGHLHSRKYIHIQVGNVIYKAHRLAWLYVTGTWPVENIDHINGNRSDNRIDNLREATDAENIQNQRHATIKNASGIMGVRKGSASWHARITVNKKPIHIGCFSTPELAHQAYLEAKRIYHPFCTI